MATTSKFSTPSTRSQPRNKGASFSPREAKNLRRSPKIFPTDLRANPLAEGGLFSVM